MQGLCILATVVQPVSASLRTMPIYLANQYRCHIDQEWWDLSQL
jgi:hypothetical protein